MEGSELGKWVEINLCLLRQNTKNPRDVLIVAMEAVSIGTSGRSTFLSSSIEKDLADNVVLLSLVHNPLTRGKTLNIVQEYCEEKKFTNPFSKKPETLSGEEQNLKTKIHGTERSQ
ncbi:hypothetical protein Trydic_g22754 [Trypoxylus dichotomus]